MLINYLMPEMDGFEVLGYLNKNGYFSEKFIPVIATSASRYKDVMLKFYEIGAYSFLRYPLEPKELIDYISNAIKDILHKRKETGGEKLT